MHVLWRHVSTNNTHYINNDENEKNGHECNIFEGWKEWRYQNITLPNLNHKVAFGINHYITEDAFYSLMSISHFFNSLFLS